MGKRIEMEGGFYRMRRDKLVKIPDEWVDKVTHEQTKRKRMSKQPASVRRNVSRNLLEDGSYDGTNYRGRRHSYVDGD